MKIYTQNRKYLWLARAVIVLSSLGILHLTYLIIVTLMEENLQPFIGNDHYLPDIAEMMTWGQGGSGVIVDPSKIHRQLNADSERMHSPSRSILWGSSDSVKEEIQTGYRLYGLNEYVSNRISLRRSLPDMREPACRTHKDLGSRPRQLPAASVIMLFKEEPRSVLLRAVLSVLDRTPPDLLTEIILVDRGSNNTALGYPQLEHYLNAISKKVKVVRNQAGLNYPEAINLGASTATGSAVVFLSAQCECTEGWLKPLLYWITHSSFSIAVPVVDVIDGDTFRYNRTPMSNVKVGSFSWDMTIKRKTIMIRPEASSHSIPEATAVIADGIFAMERELFLSSGGLSEVLVGRDLSLLEYSFRSWMCGSVIQLVPCSRVGLVSLPSTEKLDQIDEKVALAERATVVDWWLGEFKSYAYERLDMLTETFKLQLDLHDPDLAFVHRHPKYHRDCQDFRWFLEKLEPAKLMAGRVLGSGRLEQGELALTVGWAEDISDQHKVELKKFPKLPVELSLLDGTQKPQFWYILDNGQLQTEDFMCLYHPERRVPSGGEKQATKANSTTTPKSIAPLNRSPELLADILAKHTSKTRHKSTGSGAAAQTKTSNITGHDTGENHGFVVIRCDLIYPRVLWKITKDSQLLYIPTEKCLESQALKSSTYTLQLAACSENQASQRWHISHRDPLEEGKSVYEILGL